MTSPPRSRPSATAPRAAPRSRSGVLQRCYRDIHAATQHILLADEVVQECGRVLLGGTKPDAKWNVFGVEG